MKYVVTVDHIRYVVNAGSISGAVRNALAIHGEPKLDANGTVAIDIKPVLPK